MTAAWMTLKISIENTADSVSSELNDIFPLKVEQEKGAQLFSCFYFINLPFPTLSMNFSRVGNVQ